MSGGTAGKAPSARVVAVSTWCASHVEPEYSDDELAAMSDRKLARTLADDDYGEAHCGWTR